MLNRSFIYTGDTFNLAMGQFSLTTSETLFLVDQKLINDTFNLAWGKF